MQHPNQNQNQSSGKKLPDSKKQTSGNQIDKNGNGNNLPPKPNDADKSAPKEKTITDYKDVTGVNAEISAPEPEPAHKEVSDQFDHQPKTTHHNPSNIVTTSDNPNFCEYSELL